MPTYDVECPECGRFEALLKWQSDPVIDCPECGASAYRMPATCRTMGIIWSNPVVFDQRSGDRGAFHSKAQLRAWEADNPDKQIVATGSSEWRAVKDDAEEHAVKAAKDLGYRDADHHRSAMRENQRKQRLRNDRNVGTRPRRAAAEK